MTSARNSAGNGFGTSLILPARTNPHRSGVNQTGGSPDRSREQLVIDLLDESRAMLVIRGGSRTTEEIDWAVTRDVGVVPLACSGGAAYEYWEANRSNPPDLGSRPTDTTLWARLNDAKPANAARAAHELLAQAMYQG
jgi:hypothetical protein